MPAGGRVDVRVNTAEIAALSRSTGAVRLMSRIGEVVTQEQKRLCPVSPVGESEHPSGQLRSSIGWSLAVSSGSLSVDIGTDLDYALPVILGTRPHVIRSKGNYPLRNRKGQVFGQQVQHPGTQPQDFARPSLAAVRKAV